LPLPPLPPGQWSPDVHRGLQAWLDELEAAPRPRVAVFDWDDTTIEGDLSLAMMRRVDRETGSSWHDTYFALLEAHGRTVAYPQITRWWAGWTPDTLRERFAALVEPILAAGEVRWREDVVALVRALRVRGVGILVVTASPALLVARMAARLGLPEDTILGMRLVLGPDGRFTDEVVEPQTWGDGKRLALLERLGRAPDFVAGDSSSDAPMMRIAERALLVDGHDAALRAEAVARGWWVQSGWSHTPPEPGVQIALPKAHG
jgi:HAD superfamily phosphoserine phosphatase-like hydrolase